MKRTRIIMGMPVTIEIIDRGALKGINQAFDYFQQVDARYSTFLPSSEISSINAGLPPREVSDEVRWVLELCEATKRVTRGYFDIEHNERLDPSGLVKGWAIQNAANQLLLMGYGNFYIEAGGDIQAYGHKRDGSPWRVGIRNPFQPSEIVKVIHLCDAGIATSGTYIRGDHIYDPTDNYRAPEGIASLSIVGPTVYDADRFATAAYAMGRDGIAFVEAATGLEGYLISSDGVATMTSGFARYAI